MKSSKSLGLVVAAASLFAAQAFAAPRCPNAPATGNPTQGSPGCIASVGQDGAGTGLQDQVNHLTTAGAPVDVNNDQAAPSTAWSLTGGSTHTNTILLEIAGNANTNTFGIYDLTNERNTLEMFSGPASTGATVSLSYNGDGTFTADGNTSAVFGSADAFGYYLGTASSGIFYSNPALNAPGAGGYFPGGMQHLMTYQGNGSTLRTGAAQVLFDPSMYLLAWEDQPFGRSDLDYNDFVVLVTANPRRNVPEPAALGMFGFGAGMIGVAVGLRRRRTRSEPAIRRKFAKS